MVDLSFSFQEMEYFLLIFMRVIGFIFIAPFFGMNNTPKRIKICLSFFIAMLLYYSITPKQYIEYTSLLGYALIVIKESATGILIGLGAQLCMSIMNFAGRLVDMEIGLSMANQLDPSTKESTTITGLLFNYMFYLIFLITGMYQFLIKALAETFILIPIGKTVFHLNQIIAVMVQFLADYIIIGFRIVLPVFATILLLNSVLGILARVAPQMNMFAVGIQLKLLVGLGILFVTIIMLPSAADMIFDEIKSVMAAMVEGMA